MFEFVRDLLTKVSSDRDRVCGCVSDSHDERDLKFPVLRAKLPNVPNVDSVDLRGNCSSIEDQRKTGSCVAHATVGALELLENLQGSNFVDLSRLFVYYNARLAIGEADRDDGTQIRLALATLSSLGVCPEEVWPFDTKKVTVRPSWTAYRSGYTHRISSYYRIDGNGEIRNFQIEEALRSNHPVVFNVNVSENFMDCVGNAVTPMGKKLGRHAMIIVGFDKKSRTFILRNSWGDLWGDFGYCVAPYDWLDECSCEDVWVMTNV